MNSSSDKKEISLDLSEYESVEQLSEELFWKDMYIYISDTAYIYNSNSIKWYSIEHKYNYADIRYLLSENKKVSFYEIEDNDIIKELEKEFLD